MQKILVIGAGRSATALIHYLLEKSVIYDWKITVADHDLNMAIAKVNQHPNGNAIQFEVEDKSLRHQLIESHDMVVSLLPAFLHMLVAEDCIELKKNLATASYVSKEMKAREEEIVAAGLTFLNEVGLDPGIDHMSAMQKIEEIKSEGGVLTAFYSHTGGLIAPESDTNPWHYKITWNPRNVVLAGQGTAQYLENNQLQLVPYNQLFDHPFVIDVPNLGKYDVYPNRDSISYRSIYHIDDIPTIMRGTIRHHGYCKSWNLLVKLGLTDSTTILQNLDHYTNRALLASITRFENNADLENKVAEFLGVNTNEESFQNLIWLGLFENKPIQIKTGTLADWVESVLVDKWKLSPTDKDMIIMQHEFHYEINGQKKVTTSSMISKGADAENTAMSRLVGITLGIGVKLMMLGKINAKGIVLPTSKSIYEPVLEELLDYDVRFRETEMILN